MHVRSPLLPCQATLLSLSLSSQKTFDAPDRCVSHPYDYCLSVSDRVHLSQRRAPIRCSTLYAQHKQASREPAIAPRTARIFDKIRNAKHGWRTDQSESSVGGQKKGYPIPGFSRSSSKPAIVPMPASACTLFAPAAGRRAAPSGQLVAWPFGHTRRLRCLRGR